MRGYLGRLSVDRHGRMRQWRRPCDQLRKRIAIVSLPLFALGNGASIAADRPVAPEVVAAIERQVPDRTHVIAIEQKNLNGEAYTFVKTRTSDDVIEVAVYDRDGARLPTTLRPPNRQHRSFVTGLDAAARRAGDLGRPVRLRVGLRIEPVTMAEPIEWGDAGVDAAPGQGRVGRPRIFLDGREVDEPALLARVDELQQRVDGQARIDRSRAAETLRGLAARQGWLGRAEVRRALQAGDPSVVLDLSASEIQRLRAEEAVGVEGIEPWEQPAADSTLEGAMISTKIEPYALDYPARRGGGVGIYTTDVGCPNPTLIGNYIRLSGARFLHSDLTTIILHGVSPDATIYCRAGPVPPTATDLAGYNGLPRIHIISQSYSQYDDPSYTILDRDVDDFIYKYLVLHFNSAGNTGGYVRSPGKGLNVITLGNYDDSTNTVASNSSWKDPETHNMKPELSMPGTNITILNYSFSGTSASTPHAAGFAADLTSAYSWYRLRPHLLKAAMLAGASKPIAGGSERVGVGGGDFQRAFYRGRDFWWSGPVGSFEIFDAQDVLPDNGTIDVFQDLQRSATNVRVVLAWLTRGTYTYAHRNDAHPIGLDLDLFVYAPDGSLVASSASFDNPFEAVSFVPQVAGPYRFSIRSKDIRDIKSALRVGLKIDW